MVKATRNPCEFYNKTFCCNPYRIVHTWHNENQFNIVKSFIYFILFMKSPLSPVILYCFTLTECLQEVQDFFLSIPYNKFIQIKISISLAQNFQIHSRDIKFYCDFFFHGFRLAIFWKINWQAWDFIFFDYCISILRAA